MTILEFYEGLDAAKRTERAKDEPVRSCRVSRYDFGGYVEVSRKKKGTDKSYKVKYEWRWSDRKGYCEALRRTNPTEYGLMLCREELGGMNCDKWWDTPSYRRTAIKDYRGRIAAIRKEYGLSYESVKEFYNVG